MKPNSSNSNKNFQPKPTNPAPIARSEFLLAPIHLELETLLTDSISLFSGEDFTVDRSLGLNGICDFLIARAPAQLIFLDQRSRSNLMKYHFNPSIVSWAFLLGYPKISQPSTRPPPKSVKLNPSHPDEAS